MNEEKTYQQLKEDYEKLLIEHNQLKKEFETVESTIVKLLKALGIIPYNPEMNILGTLLKKAGRIMTESLINPDGVKKEFSFITDLEPIANKYTKTDLS